MAKKSLTSDILRWQRLAKKRGKEIEQLRAKLAKINRLTTLTPISNEGMQYTLDKIREIVEDV